MMIWLRFGMLFNSFPSEHGLFCFIFPCFLLYFFLSFLFSFFGYGCIITWTYWNNYKLFLFITSAFNSKFVNVSIHMTYTTVVLSYHRPKDSVSSSDFRLRQFISYYQWFFVYYSFSLFCFYSSHYHNEINQDKKKGVGKIRKKWMTKR